MTRNLVIGVLVIGMAVLLISIFTLLISEMVAAPSPTRPGQVYSNGKAAAAQVGGIKKAEGLRVGLIGFVPPYTYGDTQPGAAVKGSDVQILEAIFNKANLSYTLIQRRHPQLREDFEKGDLDIIVLHGEPFEGCFATRPFTYWQDVVFIRQEDETTYVSPSDLVGKRVGVYPDMAVEIRNAATLPYSFYKSTQISIEKATIDGYRRLQEKRIDAFIGEENIMMFHHLITNPQKAFPFTAIAEFPKDFHRLCVKSANLRDRLDTLLRDYYADNPAFAF